MGIEKISPVIGIIFIVIGVLFLIGPYIPFLGKLPGDIEMKGDNYSIYFPVVTCVVISVVLSVLFNLFGGGK